MIDFFSETEFQLEQQDSMAEWIANVIASENCTEGDISYIFCDDEYLHKLNVPFTDELHRVMIHGILHFCGYKDKSVAEENQMRSKEDEALRARTFL